MQRCFAVLTSLCVPQMWRWLCYGNDPSSTSSQVDKTYINRREMSFTIANDIYIRYQCFKDKADMVAQIQKMQVSKPFDLPWCTIMYSIVRYDCWRHCSSHPSVQDTACSSLVTQHQLQWCICLQ